MKQKKLLDRLRVFFDSDERERQQQIDDISAVLKKLKKRERKLKERLSKEEDEQVRSRLEQDISVIYAQRKKGVKILKEDNI